MIKRSLVIILVFLCGVIPIFSYWVFLGGVPTVTAGEAIQMLNDPKGENVLVDVRDAREFSMYHVSGAMNWELEEILKVSSPQEIPASFRKKTILIVCKSGFLSTKAARHLSSLGADVYNVRGGMQEWAKAGPQFPHMGSSMFSSEKGDYFASKEMNVFEQFMAVFAGFLVKPAYMILSLVIVWMLRKAKSCDLVALRWGMLLFFVGEAFCAANYLFFGEDSYIAEYLHSYGMVAAFGFTAYALIEGADVRMIKFGIKDKKCSALEMCGSCFKHEDVACRARQVVQLLIPFLIVLSFIPLLAQSSHASYTTGIFGTPYHYSNPVIYQMFEIRYCPPLSILFFILAFLALNMKPAQPVPPLSRLLFAAGLGALGFSIFRLAFRKIFEDDLIWSVFWEEATEMLFVTGVVLILWLFRKGLWKESSPDRTLS